jgi:diguanylate cyclase (GGDEF)-like protein
MSTRSWAVRSLPANLRTYIFIVEATAVVLAVSSVIMTVGSVTMSDAIRCGIFVGLFAFFQRISERIERLRIRVADSHQIDMNSVWTFGGVVALPAGLAALLAIFIALAMARLRWRNGHAPHRQAFNAATVVLACLVGSTLLHDARPHIWQLPGGATEALAVLIAIVIYTLVNTSLVSGAIYLASRPIPVRALFGTWEENALELATLCLGGMTAIVAIYVPWLTALAVVPMVVLQRGALIKQLEVAATTDQKTGLLNAVTWRQIVGKELARAERDRSGAALMIIDMDNFKAVNDTHGHMVGDAVLKAAADCLTDELREYDTVGRFGGEEFVALLPDVVPEVAARITERVLERIRTMHVESPDDPTKLLSGFSASIGVALYPHHGTEAELLLHAADAALYEAKRAGRDRVQFVGAGA